MTDDNNPIFGKSGQNPPWHSSELPKQNSQPKVPAAIKNLVSELGLRFPTTSQTDAPAHASRLALLAMDLRDMPPHILKQSIERYVLIPGKNFLPKAAELVEIARSIIDRKQSESRAHPTDVEGYAAWFNENFKFAQARIVMKKRDNDDDPDADPVKTIDFVNRPLATNSAPPLTDAEIRKMPQWIINLGIAIEDLDADYCARIRSA